MVKTKGEMIRELLISLSMQDLSSHRVRLIFTETSTFKWMLRMLEEEGDGCWSETTQRSGEEDDSTPWHEDPWSFEVHVCIFWILYFFNLFLSFYNFFSFCLIQVRKPEIKLELNWETLPIPHGCGSLRAPLLRVLGLSRGMKFLTLVRWRRIPPVKN